MTLLLGTYAYAHDWPSNLNDWTKDDWEAWDNAFNDYWKQWEEAWKHWESPWHEPHYNDRPYNYGYYESNNNYNNNYYIDERGNIVYYNNYNNYGGYNSNTKGNGNGYNNAYNYGSYNYYGGILDVYDAGTEGQAVILAKIIHLYGHGVASQTQQACVGWTVLNSVDASGGGVDIGAIAPNFHYNAAEATIDDFGRDLMPLARDIIFRWKAGRAGCSNNGRVLPLNYCYVTSTGSAVTFTDGAGSMWNFSATTPYGS